MDNLAYQHYDPAPARQTPLRREQAGQVNLFCFPHSGASAATFWPWVNNIPTVHVHPVDLPGHGTRMRESLLSTLPALIRSAAQTLLPALQPPFAFFGHSMGALVCFEMARHLRQNYGLEPVHLFVSGHPAPHLPSNHNPLHQLPEAEFVEKVREMNGTEEDFFTCQELRELFLPILRADFAACETYQYQDDPPLDCPITALGGLKDRDVPRPDLDAWKAHTRGAFKVRMFPGDHFFLNSNRLALFEILARELQAK